MDKRVGVLCKLLAKKWDGTIERDIVPLGFGCTMRFKRVISDVELRVMLVSLIRKHLRRAIIDTHTQSSLLVRKKHRKFSVAMVNDTTNPGIEKDVTITVYVLKPLRKKKK